MRVKVFAKSINDPPKVRVVVFEANQLEVGHDCFGLDIDHSDGVICYMPSDSDWYGMEGYRTYAIELEEIEDDQLRSAYDDVFRERMD